MHQCCSFCRNGCPFNIVHAFVLSRAAKDDAEREALHGQLDELQAQLARMKDGPSKDEAAHLGYKICQDSNKVFVW